MREICQSGSEGGEGQINDPSLPLSNRSLQIKRAFSNRSSS
jgi:hypothetical protein